MGQDTGVYVRAARLNTRECKSRFLEIAISVCAIYVNEVFSTSIRLSATYSISSSFKTGELGR